VHHNDTQYFQPFVTKMSEFSRIIEVQWIDTRHLAQPDLFVAVSAWFSNLLVIIGCVWAYSRRPGRPFSDVGRLLICYEYPS